MDHCSQGASSQQYPRTGALMHLNVQRIQQGNDIRPADVGWRWFAEQALEGASLSRPHEPEGITDAAAMHQAILRWRMVTGGRMDGGPLLLQPALKVKVWGG